MTTEAQNDLRVGLTDVLGLLDPPSLIDDAKALVLDLLRVASGMDERLTDRCRARLRKSA